MVSCNVLDFECVIVNEIFGSVVLAIIGLAILYFMTAWKLRFGPETMIALSVPVILIISLFLGGFTIVYAFATLLVVIMIAFIFNRIISGR